MTGDVQRRVAEVLYDHRYGYTSDYLGREWAVCQGCEWGRGGDERIARGPGYDAHRAHQAAVLAAEGLLADDTPADELAEKGVPRGAIRGRLKGGRP